MQDKRSLLIETQYLAPVSFFSQIIGFQQVVIEQFENYQKHSYRNRCIIASANGVLPLSIPLQSGKNHQQSIREVRIAYDTNWQRQHWQSIRSAYGSAPFFEHYADYLEPFFTSKYQHLIDFNLDLLNLALKLLKIKDISISLSDNYEKNINPTIVDSRNKMKPNERNTVLNETNDFNFKKYSQIFEAKHGFIENLSILDLLFCTGPQAKNYL